MLKDLANVLHEIATILGVVSPIIMLWMRRKWKIEETDKNALVKVFANLEQDDKLSRTVQDRVWYHLEKNLPESKIRGRMFNLINRESRNIRAASIEKSSNP